MSNLRLKLRNRTAALLCVGLLLIIAWWPSLVSALHNNLGSLSLHEALLAPDVPPRTREIRAIEASNRFRAALTWDPLNGRAYHNLATVYELRQDGPAEVQTLARAAALMPRDGVVQLRYGLALAERGQQAQAIEAWQAGGAASYFIREGQALARQGDLKRALRQHQRAVAIDPTLAEAHLRLGQVLTRLGREAEALQAFSAAAETDRGSSARPHLLRAEIHVARGAWIAALAAYGDAAHHAPDDPEPHYRRGWLLSEKLHDEEAALAAFRRALQIDPEHEPSRCVLGRLEAIRGACDTAAGWFDPLLRRPDAAEDPAEGEEDLKAELHTVLGTCWLERGRHGEALSHLEQARALAVDHPSTLLSVGRLYVRARRFDEAIEVYLRVLELAPNNQEARRALEELEWTETRGPE